MMMQPFFRSLESFRSRMSSPRARRRGVVGLGVLGLAALLAGCSDSPPAKNWACGIQSNEAPDFVTQIGCEGDFALLASEPLASTLPGARSVKTSVDREA